VKKSTALYQLTVSVLLALSTIMFSGTAQAVPVPGGFAGISWGASRADVEKAMAERNYPKDADSKADIYVYNGEFAGYKADLIFNFINNKVYAGGALFLWHETNKYLIDKYFREFESQLREKYGEPEYKYRADGGEPWKPFEDRWELRNLNTIIVLELYKVYEYNVGHRIDGRVSISYTNSTLKEQEERRAKENDL